MFVARGGPMFVARPTFQGEHVRGALHEPCPSHAEHAAAVPSVNPQAKEVYEASRV
jgi:hypothetical protein